MTPPRFRNAPNFRDLGGIETAGGRRTKPGVIYRSSALTALDAEEWAEMETLGIRLFCDLRSAGERERHRLAWPGNAPAIVSYSVLPDVRATGEAILARLISDPTGEQTRALMLENYAMMPRAFADQLPTLFSRILDDAELPMIVACTAGQDRTGFVCALILSALDVPREAIIADYLRSSTTIDAETTRAFISKSLGREVDAPSEQVISTLRANQLYLEGIFATIEEKMGGMDAYLEKVGGLTHARRDKLRELLLH